MTNAPLPDLEIGLHKAAEGGAGRYDVELRFSEPGSDAHVSSERAPTTLDIDALRSPDALASALFADAAIRGLFDRARQATKDAGRPLRLRLALPNDAPELQELPWEELCSDENVFFSRFLHSRDWRGVEIRPQTRLKALVAVAAPSDLERYKLDGGDAAAEAERVRESLGPDLEVEFAGRDEPLTLLHLSKRLRDGFDVLYLVAHGRLKGDGTPVFLLQKDDTTAEGVDAGQLALAVSEMTSPPRLAVLEADGAARLAPHLAEAGVVAVLTLPAQTPSTTALTGTFFRELLDDGQIDRAMAMARASVADRADAMRPILFLRLRRGCLWRRPARKRVFVCSVPRELQPWQATACEVVREMDMEPVLRRPDGLPGLQPVAACRQQVAGADLVLAVVGHAGGDVPDATDGGDGLHPWPWWEARAAFDEGLNVAVLMTGDTANVDRSGDDAAAVMRDFRGELRRLATSFDANDDTFRDLVRRTLRRTQKRTAKPNAENVRLRVWPPRDLPEQPYPVLLPYTHPDLMAGRDHEIDEIRQVLARPVAITCLHAPSGTGKSSFLYTGVVVGLRAEGRPVAFNRRPYEAGIVQNLLGDLLEDVPNIEDNDTDAFVDQLCNVLNAAGQPPLLVLDQFEDLLRFEEADLARRAGGAPRHALRVVGALLAASVQRLPGLAEPPCRWLLVYRQEFHGEVCRWLGNIHTGGATLPHDLLGSDRFQTWTLSPLGTPPASTPDRLKEASTIFRAAMEKPLRLCPPGGNAGKQHYAWRFAGDGAERLANAFAEAREAQRKAPLAPELQVVLAHLLEKASAPDANGVRTVIVPDDPAALIDSALEEHLCRALDIAFPVGRKKDSTLRRTRALLALRELADVQGRRGEGRPVEELVRAIGKDGRDVLEKLSTAQTRIVLQEEQGDAQVYILSHDRMAEVIVRAVDDDGAYAGLGVDAELLRLRRFVTLQRELFTSGEGQQSTKVPKETFQGIDRHTEALLWDDEAHRWWAACRERRRRDRRQALIHRSAAALILVVLTALLVGTWAQRYYERQTLLDNIVKGKPEKAFKALADLTAANVHADELRNRVRRRKKPFAVVERGLGGVNEMEERGEALIRVTELLLPLQQETPDDPEWIASMVWALDFFAGKERRERATELRDKILRPLQTSHPPPPLPGPDDPEWANIPAGTFMMGSGPGEGRDLPDMADERPRHPVQLSAFRLMIHEVTNAEFGRLFPAWATNEPDLPAVRLTWYEAYTYAAWRGGMLPTEAQYEYVMRYNCSHSYCGIDGNSTMLKEIAWWAKNSAPRGTGMATLHPIKQRKPTPLGMYDIFGNVWELSADWNRNYPTEPEVDPSGATRPIVKREAQDPSRDRPEDSGFRRSRGGSADSDERWVNAAARNPSTPSERGEWLGFRVAIRVRSNQMYSQ